MRTAFYVYDANDPEWARYCDWCGEPFQDGDEIAHQAGTYHLACWDEFWYLFADAEQHEAENAEAESSPEFEVTERLDDLSIPFSPNSSTVVTVQIRYAGRWKQGVSPIEECEDA